RDLRAVRLSLETRRPKHAPPDYSGKIHARLFSECRSKTGRFARSVESRTSRASQRCCAVGRSGENDQEDRHRASKSARSVWFFLPTTARISKSKRRRIGAELVGFGRDRDQ